MRTHKAYPRPQKSIPVVKNQTNFRIRDGMPNQLGNTVLAQHIILKQKLDVFSQSVRNAMIPVSRQGRMLMLQDLHRKRRISGKVFEDFESPIR